jgi:mono/diheme cytochrome c family protein
MGKFLLGIAVTIVIIFVGGFALLKKGYMNMSADVAPLPFEKSLAMGAVDASTERHASERKNPNSPSEENLVAGAQLYLNHCAGCHGVPSNPDAPFGRSFYPPVPAFFKDAPDMPENENFYIIAHGIRWTGMPGWNKTLTESQIWQVVTFLSNIEKLPPAASRVFEPPAAAPQPGATR